MPASPRRFIAAGLLLLGLGAQSWAEGIFTCVDSKGRRLTADRPIAECVDREQKELNPSGTVKRKVGPTLTPDEHAEAEEQDRKAADERNRQAEAKKRERALLARYPDKASHDKQRIESLALMDTAIASASKNTENLVEQRKRLDTELEFYRNDPAKVPPKLKRQVDETDQRIEAQRRFVADQFSEKERINTRFNEELVILKQMWAQRTGTASAAASAAQVPAKP